MPQHLHRGQPAAAAQALHRGRRPRRRTSGKASVAWDECGEAEGRGGHGGGRGGHGGRGGAGPGLGGAPGQSEE